MKSNKKSPAETILLTMISPKLLRIGQVADKFNRCFVVGAPSCLVNVPT